MSPRNRLLNYSIETDHLILLHFSDGQSHRVSFDQISDHLVGPDLVKVKRAMKLRRDFFRHNNLPGALATLLAIGLAVVVAVDYRDVAAIWSHARPLSSPPAGAANAPLIATPTPTEPASSPSVEDSSPASASPAAKPATAVPPVPAAPPASASGLQVPLPTPVAVKLLENLPVTIPKLR